MIHVAILTPSRPALGKVLKRLVEASYPIGGASDHLVSEALYLSDPDGNGLEIYRDRRRDEWTYIQGDLQMATEPLNLRALVNDADPTPYDAIPTGTIIGHVHLHVSDLAKAEAFYNGVLGLDVVVRNYPGALFFSGGWLSPSPGHEYVGGAHAAAADGSRPRLVGSGGARRSANRD